MFDKFTKTSFATPGTRVWRLCLKERRKRKTATTNLNTMETVESLLLKTRRFSDRNPSDWNSLAKNRLCEFHNWLQQDPDLEYEALKQFEVKTRSHVKSLSTWRTVAETTCETVNVWLRRKMEEANEDKFWSEYESKDPK